MVQVTKVPFNETSFHHGSHESLLLPVEAGPAVAGVDAIIVPTVRGPANLAQASALAIELGSTLVTLHSGTLTTAAAAVRSLPESIDLVAIDVPAQDRVGAAPSSYRLSLPRWETSDLLAGTPFVRTTDLSLKRNLALMLSHMAGWSHVLFLDDDITHLNPDDVRQASGLLGPFNAVGLRLEGRVLDHSVVCEAYRRAGGQQKSFVGGGALIAQTAVALDNSAFFPDIYNDDWFFLLDGEKGLLPTAVLGSVTQMDYDPFRTPQRALDQELGDVLAEGIYWLLDQKLSVRDADRKHWKAFVRRRRKFIKRVTRMVANAGDLKADEKKRMTAALDGALSRLPSITPDFCERYLRAWARDRDAWHRHLERLPVGISPAAALGELTQPGCPRLTWRIRPGQSRQCLNGSP